MKNGLLAVVAVLLGAGLLAGITPGQAQAQPVDPCPVVVDNTTLDTDCVGPLVVAGDNLTLNLGGHHVVCPAPPGQRSFLVDGIVLQNRTNVHVTNGHVEQCRFALYSQGGGEHSFSNLAMEVNGWGVRLEGSSDNHISQLDLTNHDQYGIQMSASSRNRLEAGIVIRNSAVAGVEINGGSNDNLVTSSTIIGPNNVGIQIVDSDRSTVQSSLLTGPDCTTGVNVAGSTATVIQANRITLCSSGVLVGPLSTLTTLVANHIDDNAAYGILGGSGSRTTHAHDNHVVRNAVGIDLRPASTGNTIELNTVLDNTQLDLEDDNPNCDSNIWVNNENVTQNQPCID